MSSQIKKVAVAGATGNTGPAVVKALSAAGFEVRVLTRSISRAKALLIPDIELVEVDYHSHDSLTSALRGGVDAVVVSGAGMLPEQTNLIDAAIAAKVPRFLPADFAADLSDPLIRGMHVHKSKVGTEEYLKAHEHEISWSSIRTGPLLDWLLLIGAVINMKARSTTIYNLGDKCFTSTTIPTAAAAVVAVLKMSEKSKNRTFRVCELVTSQKELLKLGKEVVPGEEWSVTFESTGEFKRMIDEAYAVDPESMMGSVLEKTLGIFGPEYVSDFGKGDNEELGIEMMDDDQIKELMRLFA